jgi:beta-glucanase (GH16 family)
MPSYQRIAVLVAVALSLCAGNAADVVAQIPDLPGWQLFWHDEFDGTTLNTTNWTALTRQDQNNNEKEYYTPGQVSVANGNLQLTATNQPVTSRTAPASSPRTCSSVKVASKLASISPPPKVCGPPSG